MLNTQRKHLQHLWWIGAQYPFKFSSVNFPNLQKLESKKKKVSVFFFTWTLLQLRFWNFLGWANQIHLCKIWKAEWNGGCISAVLTFFSKKYRHGGIFFPPEAALT